jgi:hypothetical protein
MPDEGASVTQLEEGKGPTMAQKWKTASARWAKEANLAYLSNPTARRDFQVQFRCNRTVPFFALIVLVLGGISLYLYWSISQQALQPEMIQEKLLLFCEIIFAIVGFSVSLITPVMAAASLIAEKQKKSLDLVVSSPVNLKSYLIGKLLVSYRFVWVFMALSLPFTAMSVLLGGGTWWNIVEVYLLLSLQGLLFTTIGIYFAALVEKAVTAIFYTYLALAGYLTGVGILAVFAIRQLGLDGFAPFQGGPLSFFPSLFPGTVMLAAGTTTAIFGVAVPNFLLAAGLTVGAVNFLLSCASGLISPMHQRKRTKLRIESSLSVAFLAGALGYAASLQQQSPPSLEVFSGDLFFATLFPLAPLLIFTPFLACYGSDSERRQSHNKRFVFRDMFGNSVAGALPYIYSLIALTSVSAATGFAAAEGFRALQWAAGPFLSTVVYAFGLATFIWSTARLSSSFGNGVKSSRSLQILSLAGILAIPLPFLVLLSQRANGDPKLLQAVWQWYALSPLIGKSTPLETAAHGIFLLCLALGIASWSEKNYVRRRQVKTIAQANSDAPATLANHLSRTRISSEVAPQTVSQRN